MRRAIFLILLAIPSALLAQEPTSLGELWQRAQRVHPALQTQKAQKEVAEAQIGVARATGLPTLTGDANYAQGTGNHAPKPGTLPADIKDKNKLTDTTLFPYWTFQANAKYTVWDFGKVRAGVASAEHGAQAADADLQTTRLAIWRDLVTVYAQALAAEAVLETARETLSQAERHRDMAQKQMEARIRTELDVLKTQTDVATAQVDVLRAEDGVRSARVTLGLAVGDAQTPEGALQPPVLDAQGLTNLQGKEQLNALVLEAVKKRPEFRGIAERLLAQADTVRAVERTGWPSLYVTSNANTQGLDWGTLIYNYGFAAGISVPLQTLWLQPPAISAARAQERALASQRDEQVLALRAELELARTALLQARKRVPAVAAQLALALATRDAAEKRYAAGVAILIELSDAEAALRSARIAQAQAELDVTAATARMLADLGRAGR